MKPLGSPDQRNPISNRYYLLGWCLSLMLFCLIIINRVRENFSGCHIWDRYWRAQGNEEVERGYSSQSTEKVFLNVCVPEPVASASPGNLLDVQIISPTPQTHWIRISAVGPSNLCSNKLYTWVSCTLIVRTTGLDVSNLKENAVFEGPQVLQYCSTSDYMWIVVKFEDEKVRQDDKVHDVPSCGICTISIRKMESYWNICKQGINKKLFIKINLGAMWEISWVPDWMMLPNEAR